MTEPGPAVTRRGRVAESFGGAEPVTTSPAAAGQSTSGAPPQGVLLLATGLALVVLGAVLGTIGGFLNAAAPRVFGVGVPVGPIVAVVGNLGAGVLGSRGTGSRLGGALPGIGWFIVVALLGSLRSEGDLVVTGDGRGVTFIVVGALAAGVALLPGAGGGVRRRGP